MSDTDAIRDLIAAYALALDADDIDGCMELFTEDAEYLVFGKTLNRDKVRKMFHRAPKGMHLTGVSLISLDGPRATARSQVLFVDTATRATRSALYDDELVKTDAGWRFRRRRCRFLTPDGLADDPAPNI